MEASDLRRLRELEAENRRLKHMYAELSLEHQVLIVPEDSTYDWSYFRGWLPVGVSTFFCYRPASQL